MSNPKSTPMDLLKLHTYIFPRSSQNMELDECTTEMSTRESALPWLSAHGDDSDTHKNSSIFVSTSPAAFPRQPRHRWVGRPLGCFGPAGLSHHSCWFLGPRMAFYPSKGKPYGTWCPPNGIPGHLEKFVPLMAQNKMRHGSSSFPEIWNAIQQRVFAMAFPEEGEAAKAPPLAWKAFQGRAKPSYTAIQVEWQESCFEVCPTE